MPSILRHNLVQIKFSFIGFLFKFKFKIIYFKFNLFSYIIIIMSLNKVVKLTSNQGGNFSATNNLVDFDIPSDGVYDLSKSYVNLMCSVPTTTTAGTPTGVFMPQIQIANDDGTAQDNRFSNIAMVKNMSLSCANKGQISNIRRVDVLRNNLNEYMLSRDERQSLENEAVIQGYDESHQLNSIFREIRKEGADLSQDRQAPVKIPLSQLCNFGKVKQFDTTKYGKSRLHLELNLDKVSVRQYLGNNTPATPQGSWGRNQGWNACLSATLARDPTLFTLDMTTTFSQLEDCPVWVGQIIRISATAGGGRGGGAIANLVRRIEEITFLPTTAGANQGQVRIRLNASFQNGQGALTGGQTYTGITIDGEAPATMNFRCDYGELVLMKVTQPQKSAPSITYTEFSTEEHNANGVQNFQRQFTVEPECVNLFIMKNEDIISKAGDIVDWRLRLNNEDLTNRPVRYNSPLSLDRINMTLGNSNNVLHNSNQVNQRVLSDDIGEAVVESYRVAGNRLVLICNPLPQTPNDKMVQVNINCGTASLNKMCLYKECVRVI